MFAYHGGGPPPPGSPLAWQSDITISPIKLPGEAGSGVPGAQLQTGVGGYGSGSQVSHAGTDIHPDSVHSHVHGQQHPIDEELEGLLDDGLLDDGLLELELLDDGLELEDDGLLELDDGLLDVKLDEDDGLLEIKLELDEDGLLDELLEGLLDDGLLDDGLLEELDGVLELDEEIIEELGNEDEDEEGNELDDELEDEVQQQTPMAPI